MTNEDIESNDIPTVSPGMFAKAVEKSGLKPRANKAQITLHLDRPVLAWSRNGYQTQIKALLRASKEASKSTRQ